MQKQLFSFQVAEAFVWRLPLDNFAMDNIVWLFEMDGLVIAGKSKCLENKKYYYLMLYIMNLHEFTGVISLTSVKFQGPIQSCMLVNRFLE